MVRRAFDEFMALPSAVIIGFIFIAGVTLFLDSSNVRALSSGREFILHYVLRTEEDTKELLGTLLTGLLTLISITFSILLLAVQQTASSLSNQVYDQFLRRSTNQVFLGYAIGLAVQTLIVRAATGKGFETVYSATAVVLLTIVGLVLLILLIYGTIYQMRPNVIIESMHDHTVAARTRQTKFVAATRSNSSCDNQVQAEFRMKDSGFLQAIELRYLPLECMTANGIELEIVVPIGTYLVRGDRLATVKASEGAVIEALAGKIRKSFRIESDRDLGADPAWGITELESMAWTTVSSAKSTPEPPRMVISALRDMLTRWANDEQSLSRDDRCPIVYRDNLHDRALEALATIAAGANEKSTACRDGRGALCFRCHCREYTGHNKSEDERCHTSARSSA